MVAKTKRKPDTAVTAAGLERELARELARAGRAGYTPAKLHAERRRLILEAHDAGLGARPIARVLGVSRRRARQIIEGDNR